ncbi:hypothetical protein [Streptomyces sp. TRM49041]|uniref:hypothetical protein n=1 Tax=Streptomyces sp. TRM49041 TaxID=2603216 RepID=UPI0011EC6FDC|nr:hypothetical protein [Streptomyces sp. TRM49041]
MTLNFRDRLGQTARERLDRVRSAPVPGGDWVMEAVERAGVPDSPATEPWEMSLGRLLATHPLVPDALAGPLQYLDGLGALRLGPESVGFDGDDVPWERATEIRAVGVTRVLTKVAVDGALEGIRQSLAGVPGRGWVMDRVSEVFTKLVAVCLTRAEEAGTVQEVHVPGEIVFRGPLGVRRTSTASLYPALFLLASPPTVKSLVATAESHGVRVV